MSILTVIRTEEIIVVSERDRTIVQMIADEKERQEIADKFTISIRTIESEIVKIKTKLGCRTLGGLVALFFRNNLIK